MGSNKIGYFDLAMRFGKCRVTLEILKKIVPEHATILISYPDNKLNETWKSECVVWEYDNPNITYVNFSSLSIRGSKFIGNANIEGNLRCLFFFLFRNKITKRSSLS